MNFHIDVYVVELWKRKIVNKGIYLEYLVYGSRLFARGGHLYLNYLFKTFSCMIWAYLPTFQVSRISLCTLVAAEFYAVWLHCDVDYLKTQIRRYHHRSNCGLEMGPFHQANSSPTHVRFQRLAWKDFTMYILIYEPF